ncbi:MAG TPA: HAMP domain-containing sensor histidine kinase [Gemmatimonadaceae bacterium]|nr:HAMP domain-containing sensor histidine kinase [Gemmatimonadaceae bacterium]
MGTEDTGSSGVRTRSTADGRRALRWLLLLGLGALALATWSRFPTGPKLAFSAGEGEPFVAPEEIRSRAVADLRRRLSREIARIQAAAETALDAPPSQDAAFDAMPALRTGDPAWGVMLYERGHRIAWSGRLHIAAEEVTAPLSVTSDRFFTTVNAAAARGERLAVASFVLHAEPPGERLSTALDEQVLAAHPIARFAYAFGDSASRGEVLLRDSAGKALLSVQALALSPGEVTLTSTARIRMRIAALLAAVLLALVWLAFRSRRLASRALGLGVCAACIGIVPLNAFSNTARWFNPSYYYSAIGGRWTASAAALMLTAILLVLGVYALIRARVRPASRAVSTVAAILATVAALYLVDALAKGIGQPPRGSTVMLWLMWQLPLFFVGFALLVLGAWLAVGTARRGSGLRGAHVVAVALVAGIMSAGTVWRTTIQQRMTLAEADVEALKTGDEYAAALLDRLGEQLSAGRPPASRGDLLQRYVVSELAIAGYPLSLRSWDARGLPLASFDAARVAQDTVAIAAAVAEAIREGSPLVKRVQSGAGAQRLLVVPHDSGATSVAVMPRTRLIAPDPFGPLLGLPPAVPERAPYVLYLADRPATGSPAGASGIAWRRIGNEEHADDAIETVSGPARVHLEVDMRSPWALFQRLVLVLLLNVLAAWVLWTLALAAEGGALTRARVRVRHWGRSYRAQLIVALFVFFLAPALAFSLWSYRRLRSDFRQTQQLVLRETLNAAIAAGAERNLELVGTRFGLPLFLYRFGELTEASDSLYWALSPVGRALHPGVYRTLELGEEITASREMSIGGTDVLFGYRASVGYSGDRFVIAAPARGDDEALARRRNDLGVLLMFSTALGAIAALLLSGIAARQFAAPIEALRRSVRAIARGEDELPLPAKPPTEFSQAFTAVRRMADDLDASRRELARAERVLAWGEMARQVAHEIKNPLTPMRLGVQHLQRARHDPRVDFDKVFDANMQRMLEEIDRLDDIARAFSRYGTAQPELPPAEPVNVSAIIDDVVELERMGGSEVAWHVSGTEAETIAMARRAELREVVLNVLENARHAGARNVSVIVRPGGDAVSIEIADDGSGIAAAALPRVFEPHFSTRTTGSGLGLAISRRLVDAWGGSIELESEEGQGTRVRIALRPAVSAF